MRNITKEMVKGSEALLSAKVRVPGSHRLERTSETLVVLEVKKEGVEIRKLDEGVAWAVWCVSQHDGCSLKYSRVVAGGVRVTGLAAKEDKVNGVRATCCFSVQVG